MTGTAAALAATAFADTGHRPTSSSPESTITSRWTGVHRIYQSVASALRGSVVVLGHAEYYPRFGFRPATEFGIHHPEFDGPNLMALSLTGDPLPAGIIRYPVNV